MITTNYLPPFYPQVRTQYVYIDGNYEGEADCCVACTLATIKDIHQYKYDQTDWARGSYSSYWIYGNRLSTDYQGEGMVYVEAMQRLRDDGVVGAYEFDDNLFYQDWDGNIGAKNRVLTERSNRLSQARLGRITNWNYYKNPSSDSVITTIQNSIKNHGAAMLGHWTFYEFYNIPSNGILPYVTLLYDNPNDPYGNSGQFPDIPPPEPNGSQVVTGHSMAIIGWKYINGVMHWICQNSWGTGWGDGGYCYIPYDHEMIIESGTIHTMEDLPSVPSLITNLNVKNAYSWFTIRFDYPVRADKVVLNYREKGTTDWIEYTRSDTLSGFTLRYSDIKPNTYYEIKVYGTNYLGNGEPTYLLGDNAIIHSVNVGAVTTLNVVASTITKGKISIAWNAITNANTVAVEVYKGNNTDSSNLVYSKHDIQGTITSWDVNGLNEYTLYTVKVFGKAPNVPNGTPKTSTVTTSDLTPPTISITGYSGLGKINVSWTASDSMSGIKNSNPYRVYIGTPNGDIGTLSPTEYTTNTYYEWNSANGSSFTPNAYYWIGIRVYDASENSTLVTQRVQFIKARPNNWEWFTPKVSGNNINLTASEWNNFTNRINEFRVFKGLSTYSFTQVNSGNMISASIVNQAINKIKDMNPPVTPPPLSVALETEITAYFFNRLRDSLNSIQ